MITLHGGSETRPLLGEALGRAVLLKPVSGVDLTCCEPGSSPPAQPIALLSDAIFSSSNCRPGRPHHPHHL
jgi:hypothetical protein